MAAVASLMSSSAVEAPLLRRQHQPKVDQIFLAPRVFQGQRSLLLPVFLFIDWLSEAFQETVNVARGVCGLWSESEVTQQAFRLCIATFW